MPSLPDAMVPALKERMRKMNQIPEEDPLQSERKRMALAGIFMNRLIRRQLKKETAELPACRGSSAVRRRSPDTTKNPQAVSRQAVIRREIAAASRDCLPFRELLLFAALLSVF